MPCRTATHIPLPQTCRPPCFFIPYYLTNLLTTFLFYYFLLKENYSALNASIGLMRAALRAGMSPASVPATTITTVAATHTPMPTVGL